MASSGGRRTWRATLWLVGWGSRLSWRPGCSPRGCPADGGTLPVDHGTLETSCFLLYQINSTLQHDSQPVLHKITPLQWRIQDFPEEGAPTLQGGCQHTILPNFPKNCMKLKEFGPPGGGARPKFYYVDPPLHSILWNTFYTSHKSIFRPLIVWFGL